MLLTAGFASCANDHSTDTATAEIEKGGLVLNIRSGSIGNTMRSATAITNGGTNTTLLEAEKKIQDITIGVFNSDGDKVGDIKQPTISDLDDATTQQYSQSFNPSDDPYAVNDSILVAINMPTTPFGSLASATTKAGFVGQTLGIDDALTYGTGTTVDPAKLPKMGKSVLTQGSGTGYFEANVNVYHMVAKVTLASLTVDFSGDAAHSGNAAFKPTQVFLYSVPDQMDLQVNANGTSQYKATVSTYYQGETTNTTNQKDYLGTSVLDVSALTTTNTNFGTTYTFYTMPNKAGKTKTDVNRTRLIIKGKYTEDVNRDATGHDAYYAINLGSTSDYSVDANVHYIVTAVIKGDGASTVNGDMPDIEHLTSTVSVADWDEEVTSVVVDNGGYTYTGLEEPKVGDYFYANGTWSTAYEAGRGAVVGIVFSTTPSAIDQAAGFKHGYVLALNNCGSATTKYQWRNANTDTGITDAADYDGNGNAFRAKIDYAIAEQVAAIKADLDGRTRSYLVSQVSGYDATTFPAFKAAADYTPVAATTTVNNSGWYLPSIGQQWVLCNNFCNLSPNTEGSWPGVAETPRDESTYRDFYYASKADATTEALNDYLTKRLVTDVVAAGGTAVTYTPFEKRTSSTHVLYWSSTEYSAAFAFYLSFDSNGNLYFTAYSSKTDAWYVRPVLAF